MAAAVRGQAQARVLDLGCGGGHVSFNVAPHVREVVAYDLSRDMLGAVAATPRTRGLANIVTQQGRVEALPFADGAFDVVMSRYSAHHWHGFAPALKEARRVLKPGGRAVFADAVSPATGLLDNLRAGDRAAARSLACARLHRRGMDRGADGSGLRGRRGDAAPPSISSSPRGSRACARPRSTSRRSARSRPAWRAR
jgi:SAM-dependent methyltransferase